MNESQKMKEKDMRRWRYAIAAGPLAVALATASMARADHLPDGDSARGETLFNGPCIACHGPDGTGTIPGVPDFTKDGGPLSKPDDVLFAHMRDGFQSGGGMAMPPKGGNPSLTEQDLVDLLAYMRKAFGGE